MTKRKAKIPRATRPENELAEQLDHPLYEIWMMLIKVSI
jgi:hypothetical protein